jgi:spore germination protein
MKKIQLLILNIFFLACTAGCTSERKIIDDIDLVTAVGYDYVDKNHVRGTVTIPVFKPDKTVSSEMFTNVSSLIRENREKLDAESNKPLLSGKLELALYNEELAEHGIYDYLDFLNRDPSIGSRVFLAVVEGKAKDYLKTKYENEDTGLYIAGIIEKNIEKGTIPKTNLHQLLYRYYSKGGDIFLPLLALKDDKVKIDGIALFMDDKYVGKIPFKKLFAFKTLVEDSKFGIYPLHAGKHSAALENVQTKRHLKLTYDGPKPKVDIHISITGVIREYKGDKVSHEVVHMLEKQMEQRLNKDYKSIISQTQKLNIDSLAIGNFLNSQVRFFNLNRYKDYYREMPIRADVKVKITEYGVKQ